MSEEANQEPASAWRSMARSLAHRNYRLFFVGQGISLIGTWMTRVATGWLVFRLSGPDSALLLGIVGFAGQVPSFFLTPFAGVLVDRWNRHRLLVLTQILSLIQSALLAAVAFRGEPGTATIWQVVALSLFQGVINAFDMPARQAFLVEMIARKEDLSNAIALNSSLVNGARLIGPSLEGLLIALAGEGWCFLLDAISYVAVVLALLAMRLPAREVRHHPQPMWHGMLEGFHYAFGFAPIRTVLLLLALVSFMGMPYTVLMPIFAADILQGGPYALGFLSAASGVGALIGALYLASRRSVLGLGNAIVIATFIFGVGLVGFAFSTVLWLSLTLMLLTGFGMMVSMAASNTILQTIVDEDKRGRVMSYFGMAFLGMSPFGSLFAGALAGWIGAANTVMVGGFACMAGAVMFAIRLPYLRTLIRPIYARMGILPEAASGVQSATDLTQPPAN
ncbi:MAG TPA: MFS transporter [Gemmataceae bacterium]|nr:MFS transporter [Gemmataceae bacterium]